MDVTVLLRWQLWKARNDLIFDEKFRNLTLNSRDVLTLCLQVFCNITSACDFFRFGGF
jgi:hypothetical protein